MLELLAGAAASLVATQSSSPRALTAEAVMGLGARYFGHVEHEPDPAKALVRARELGDDVLVTGSLYLLADLHLVAAGRQG
jgi:folylpolyglutamate synthase/dihydropteroate synthase